MPPKRKNKATKAPPTTPQSRIQSAGQPRTSSTTKRRSSVVAGGRTSRLQPSEPLHMTTRGAAKAASIHTSSAATSVANSSSRRSSLNDVAQFEDGQFDVEDERPAKRSRVSTDSGSPSSATGSVANQNPVIEAQTSGESKPMSRATSNASKTSKTSKTSNKKRRVSGDSTQSTKTVSTRANGVLTQSESYDSEKQPRRKKRKTSETAPEPADLPPELTDASTAPGSPEQMPEIQSNQGLQNVLPTASLDAPAKATRRLPGRRRQPHPDVNVETDLRRQLNIKMSYRSLAKIQKTLLEELSNRTTNSLEEDAQYYKQCPEYPGLKSALDNHLQSRLNQVHAERDLKLKQLERLRIAEEHIQNNQRINRFKDLQNDFLLQCYHRMKQIEREQKGQYGDGTDDEQNIIEPARLDFAKYGVDDRLGSKFSSRSRAYVETEHMIDDELVRQEFQRQQRAFMGTNEDIEDSVQTLPGGFAKFNGPDRNEAIAHYNFNKLVDAALEIEKTPQPEPPQVIPNEQASALFLLASLSADIPQETVVKNEQQQQQMPPAQVATPAPQTEPNRIVSPLEHLSSTSATISLETPKSSATKHMPIQKDVDQGPVRPEIKGNSSTKEIEVDVVKNEPPMKISTHRIMDILNDDMDVPISKLRESQPPASEKATSGSPQLHRQTVDHNPSSFHNSAYQKGATAKNQEQSDNDQPVPDPEEDNAPPRTSSTPPKDQYWSNRNVGGLRDFPSEHALPKQNPIDRIREMLERKARAEGKTLPPIHRRDRDRASLSDHRQDGPSTRRDSNDNSQMAAPPLSRAFSPQEKSSTTSRDSRRPSVGGSQSYEQSPQISHTYPPSHLQSSQDQGSPHWGHSRRPSAPQAPSATQYNNSSVQPYPPDYNRSDPTPPTHQSPYPPPTSHQLPSISQSLPAKPPGPPPSAPINFRFAHYDPAPPRSTYPPPAPAKYAPTSHPPHSDPHRSGPHHPGPHHSVPQNAGLHHPGPHYPDPYRPGHSHSGPPPPPQYPGPYNGSQNYQGYVPPLGSFQAPPPPPPPPPKPHSNSHYPPLKIHQYGGQPILPANMAPPHPLAQGPLPHSQPGPSLSQGPPPQAQPGPVHAQSPLSQGLPPPSHSHSQPPMSYMNQPALASSYSPPASMSRNPQYEHVANMPREGPPERPEPQQRPRRQYRSYHAPGTQFRTYQGPDTGGRRRGT